MKKTSRQEALVGIGQLERLAGAYEKTARTLKGLAKGLRRIMAGVGEPQVAPTPQKARQTARKAIVRKGQMSAAAKKRLSAAMKARWAEKKAQAQRPQPARRAADQQGNAA